MGSGRSRANELAPGDGGHVAAAPGGQEAGADVQEAGNDLAQAAERQGGDARPSFDSLNASLSVDPAGGLEIVVDEPDGPGCLRAPLVFDDPNSALAGEIFAAAGNKTELNVRKSGRFTSVSPDRPGCFEPIGADEAAEEFATGDIQPLDDGGLRLTLTGATGETTSATIPPRTPVAEVLGQERMLITFSRTRFSTGFK